MIELDRIELELELLIQSIVYILVNVEKMSYQ